LRQTADIRRRYLFACACFRPEWSRLHEKERHVVERFEAQADGGEMESAERPALAPLDQFRSFGDTTLVEVQLVILSRFLRFGGLTSVYRPVDPLKACLLREVFGSPFRKVQINDSWRTLTVSRLATAAYAERELPSGHLQRARLAVLSDALEEA